MKKTSTLLIAIALASCAKPDANVAVETPVNPPANRQPAERKELANLPTANEKITPLPLNKDNLRIPDMLELPQDDQLRSAPAEPKSGNATVIARPPEE